MQILFLFHSLVFSFFFDTDRFFFVTHYRSCHFPLNCLCLFFLLHDNDDDWQSIIFFLAAMSFGYRLFLSRLFLVVPSVSFFFSLYYSSIRVGTAKSVVVIHPIERQLLNIPVLLCFPFLYASSSILFFPFSSSFGSIVDDDDDDDDDDLSLSHSLSLCMW